MASSVKVVESRFVKSCTSIANAPQILSAEIAILGRSNVGKSSLINALLNNKNLAKSSATPGKTRLVNFFESKWKVYKITHPLAPSAREGESVDCFGDESPRNDGNSGESAKQTQKQSKGLRCCFGLFSRETSEIGLGRPSSEVLCENNPNEYPRPNCKQSEFTIHILDFPGFGYAKVSKTERDSWDKNLSAFLKKRESIKLFIHLIDSRHTNLPLDDEIRAFLRSNLRADADILEVFTKADKLKKSEIHALKGKILVSVTKKDLGQRDFKDSIESLRHAILRTMYHI